MKKIFLFITLLCMGFLNHLHGEKTLVATQRADSVFVDGLSVYKGMVKFYKTNPDTPEGNADSAELSYSVRFKSSKVINGKRTPYSYVRSRSIMLQKLEKITTRTVYELYIDGVRCGDSITDSHTYRAWGSWYQKCHNFQDEKGNSLNEKETTNATYTYEPITKTMFDYFSNLSKEAWEIKDTVVIEKPTGLYTAIRIPGPDKNESYRLSGNRTLKVHIGKKHMEISLFHNSKELGKYFFSKSYGTVRKNSPVFSIYDQNGNLLKLENNILVATDKNNNQLWKQEVVEGKKLHKNIELAFTRGIISDETEWDYLLFGY